MGRVAGRFARVEPRQRVRAFVLGLLADLPRENCWTIAEHAGDASPDGMQHRLGRAVWDEDKVRDNIRDSPWMPRVDGNFGRPAGEGIVEVGACLIARWLAATRNKP